MTDRIPLVLSSTGGFEQLQSSDIMTPPAPVVPQTSATSDTAIKAAITAASNGLASFPYSTYSTAGITTGSATKIDGNGAVLQASTTNITLLTIDSTLTLETEQSTTVRDLILDGNSASGVIGLTGSPAGTGPTPYCGAQLILEGAYVVNCVTGFDFGSTQFMRAYNLQVYNCSGAGILLRNDPSAGGGNSNDFYQPHLVSNAVGVVVDGTHFGGISGLNFYNPQWIGNSVCGAAFFETEATIYGGTPENNGSGASTIVINGRTVKRSSLYLNNSSINLNDFQIEEASVNPCILIENGSVLNCRNIGGYGDISGQLISADSTSVVNFSGNFSATGLVNNVGSWPDSINPNTFAGFYGQPSITVTPELSPPLYSSQNLPDLIASIASAPTISIVEDSNLGSASQIVFQAVAGTIGGASTARVVTGNTASSGPVVVSCLIKATTNTTVGVSLTANTNFAYAGGFEGNIALEANRPVRVTILTNAVSSANPIFVWFTPTGTDGPTLLVSNLQVYQGASYTDPTAQADIDSIVSKGAFWPGPTRDTATNIQSKVATVNTVGKYPGKQIWDTTDARVLFSAGTTNTSVWKDGSNNTVYTPS